LRFSPALGPQEFLGGYPERIASDEKLEAKAGATVTFTDTLSVGDEGSLTLSAPTTAKAVTTSEAEQSR
jgi:ribosomal protein L21